QDRIGIHSAIDELNCYPLLEFFVGSLREVDSPHPPAPNFANQSVRSEATIDAWLLRAFECVIGGRLHYWRLKEIAYSLMRCQQRLHLLLKRRIAAALFGDERSAVGGLLSHCCIEQTLDLFPGLRGHRGTPSPELPLL